MGFRVDSSATLVLDGYDGAEVTVQIGVPLAGLREWDASTSLDDEWAIFFKYAKPEWNLEDAQGEIPADVEALTRLPLPVSRAMMRGWRLATVQPPAPLPQPSSDTTE